MSIRRFHDYQCIVTDIDRRQCSRQVPMKVLALGMCRTALTTALKMLGINDTYHGYSCAFANPRDCELWYEGLTAKYVRGGKQFGRREFDQLLGHCQAVADFPAIAFAPELIAAYPDAKVILTIREFDSWYRSMASTFQRLLFRPYFPVIESIECITFSKTRWLWATWRIIWKHVFGHDIPRWLTYRHGVRTMDRDLARKSFERHYSEIERLVPPARLLKYSVQQGWEPLCSFLGAPHPNAPFPSGNSGEAFRKRFDSAVLHGVIDFMERVLVNISIAIAASFLLHFTFDILVQLRESGN